MAKLVELEDEQRFKLTFGGKDFTQTLNVVKSLPGRVYHKDGSYWTVPINPEIIAKLKEAKFTFHESVNHIVAPEKNEFFVPKRQLLQVKIDERVFHKDLRPYQKEAVMALCQFNGRGILSFPPGCGKTAVASSYFRVNLDHLPILIICPAFLKVHWKRELRKWGGLGSYICEGRKQKKGNHSLAWIINYDILPYWQDLLIGMKFKSIIIDECQMVANTETNRTDSFLQIAKHTPHIIAISGTPIKNRPKEFYTILHALDPKVFNNKWKFLHRFCGAHIVYGCWNFDGASHIDELHEIVSQYMIRKEKAELLPELPPKRRYVIPMELENPEAYKEAEQEIELLIKQNKKKQAYEQLMELSNTAFPLKKKAVLAWIDDWLSKNPEESLVIGAYHHAVIDYLEDYYEGSIVVDGRHPANKRQEQVDAFQRGEARILIGQIQAAGIGFTMTKAATMIIAEVCYVPGDLEQLEERLHRISQLADKVEIYYLVGEETIEDAMLDKVQRKANTISKILDGKSLDFFKEVT